MPDEHEPAPPVVPPVAPVSSRTVLTHTAICVVVLLLAGLACAHFNVSSVLTDALLTTVGLVLVASGLMDANSAANSKTLAVQLTTQLNEAIKAVQADLVEKHAINAAKIAVHEIDIKALEAHPALGQTTTIVAPEISLVNPPEKE